MFDEPQPCPVKVYTLHKHQELRIEGDDTNRPAITLLKGTAEIFGTEMVPNKEVQLPLSSKFGIFTWHGCSIRVSGILDSVYIGKETQMAKYAEFTSTLDSLRDKARENGYKGPRILVCGPRDVGKASLIKILCSYSARLGASPILVDIDVEQNLLSVPGTLTAAVVDSPFDLTDFLCFTDNSFVLHFGHTSVAENVDLYLKLVERMGEAVEKKLGRDGCLARSGVILKCSNWTRGGGLDCIRRAIQVFQVDIVVVVDQERLYCHLADCCRSRQLLLMAKCPGAVERTPSQRKLLMKQMIHRYFYSDQLRLFPHMLTLSIDDMTVYQIGSPEIPESCLPLGMTDKSYRVKPVAVKVVPAMANHLMSVPWDATSSHFEYSNICAVVVFKHVDLQQRKVQILSPTTTKLPSNIFFYSDCFFIDSA